MTKLFSPLGRRIDDAAPRRTPAGCEQIEVAPNYFVKTVCKFNNSVKVIVPTNAIISTGKNTTGMHPGLTHSGAVTRSPVWSPACGSATAAGCPAHRVPHGWLHSPFCPSRVVP